MTTLSDTALAFLKRTQATETLAPCMVTATLLDMIVDLAEFLHDAGGHVRHDLPRDARIEFAECVAGAYLVKMSVMNIASELLALRVDDTIFDLPATCGAPANTTWTARERLRDILGDVYRELLVRLVDVDMAGEHPSTPISPAPEESDV